MALARYQLRKQPGEVVYVSRAEARSLGPLEVFDAVAGLAHDPHSESATAWRRSGFLRLRVGRYRVLYEVDKQWLRIGVIHLGRSGSSAIC